MIKKLFLKISEFHMKTPVLDCWIAILEARNSVKKRLKSVKEITYWKSTTKQTTTIGKTKKDSYNRTHNTCFNLLFHNNFGKKM